MEELIQKLKDFFEKKNEISLAFLFGSAAAGRLIPESDLDVAVWFDKEPAIEEVNKIWREMEGLVSQSVDLIVLNHARPTVAWSAMRGKPLILRNYYLYLKKMLEFSREAEDFQNFIFDFWALHRKLRGSFA